MGPDILPKQAAVSIHWQRFAVPYEFPVVFTEEIFHTENPALREELSLEGMHFQPTGRLLRDLLIEWTRKKKVLE